MARQQSCNLRKTCNLRLDVKQMDVKQNIGKPYARLDGAGLPFSFLWTRPDQTATAGTSECFVWAYI